MKTARLTAFNDISEFIKNEFKGKSMTRYKSNEEWFAEMWVVTPTYLNSKEIRKLNKMLGIHKINKENNYNNLIRK